MNNNAKPEGHNLIPADYYPAKAIQVKDDAGVPVWVQFGKSSKGTKQCTVAFEITEGAFAGRRFTWFGYFTPDAWERTVESLIHCGFKGNDLAVINRQRLDQPVSIKITHEKDNQGVMRARLAFVNRPGGGAVILKDPMHGDEFNHFAASMAADIAGLRAGDRSLGASSAAPPMDPMDDYGAPPPPGDDDILY